jgi:hypothetical protein
MTLMKTSLHSLGKEDLGMSKIARRWEREKGRGGGVKKGNEKSNITNTSIIVVIVILIISLWNSECPNFTSHFS